MGGAVTEAVVWHELECAAYGADLELWRELAAAEGDPVLDIGAGTGRVALALARDGHDVVAVERDPELAAELRRRARGLALRVVCADARELSLRRRFCLCVVPMQTLQLFGGTAGRARFLQRVRRLLRPGGLLAAALLPPAFEEFDAAGGTAPEPDRIERDGVGYSSRPTALRIESRQVVIERLRERLTPGGVASAARDVVCLDRVTAAEVAAEAQRFGFVAEPVLAVPETADHVGSEVVMLRA